MLKKKIVLVSIVFIITSFIGFLLVFFTINTRILTPTINSKTAQNNSSYQSSVSLGNGINQYKLSGFIKKEGVQYQSLSFEILEIADTSFERSTGLMNRNQLCQKCGMLFVFDNQANLNFWMLNTKISLDIVFFDENGKVVSISKDTKPNQTAEQYPSLLPAKFVLEINANLSNNFGLVEGGYYDLEAAAEQGIDFQWK